MPADGLAPCGARPSAGRVLIAAFIHVFTWLSLTIDDDFDKKMVHYGGRYLAKYRHTFGVTIEDFDTKMI